MRVRNLQKFPDTASLRLETCIKIHPVYVYHKAVQSRVSPKTCKD
ncbi:hypothetical protein HMPREF9554_01659 [Treponema phagedenis F0421]|nr:hypothetical protein HMPREF9554_01659 [Treponema phagedenis F0421]